MLVRRVGWPVAGEVEMVRSRVGERTGFCAVSEVLACSWGGSSDVIDGCLKGSGGRTGAPWVVVLMGSSVEVIVSSALVS